MGEQIRFNEYLSSFNDNQKNQGLFISKPAADWINESKSKPIPKMLFDEFWFEGELCVLFADTNQGKSILAVQIADSISRGVAIDMFQIGVKAQKVLYFDFELSDKQFEARYSEQKEGEDFYCNHYNFNPNFIRSEINCDFVTKPNVNYDDLLLESLEQEIKSSGAKVVIIDNITYLKSELEKSKDAAPFIQKLKRLTDKGGLSILVLAHTPKRDTSKPLSINDISGSKMIANFIDSAFALGESRANKSLKYLKQIKVRHKEFKYHLGKVMVCAINKLSNFLALHPKYTDHENEHLKIYSKSDASERAKNVRELKSAGLKNTQIADKLGISEGTVRNDLKSLDS